MKRYEYVLDLKQTTLPATAVPDWLTCRPPLAADTAVLADLMMDAYPGSIDFEGSETWDDARREVEGFFQGVHGTPLPDCSRLVWVGHDLASACLVGMWDQRQRPLIYSIMTAAIWQGQGLAGLALHHALHRLIEAGYPDVRAVITAGNIPSETLFTRAGFTRITERS